MKDVQRQTRLITVGNQGASLVRRKLIAAGGEFAYASAFSAPAVFISHFDEQEWMMERVGYAVRILHESIDVDMGKRGGIPVLKGTRFTVSQLFAEIASEGDFIPQFCERFDLNVHVVTQLFDGLAICFDRPFTTADDSLSPRRMLER